MKKDTFLKKEVRLDTSIFLVVSLFVIFSICIALISFDFNSPVSEKPPTITMPPVPEYPNLAPDIPSAPIIVWSDWITPNQLEIETSKPKVLENPALTKKPKKKVQVTAKKKHKSKVKKHRKHMTFVPAKRRCREYLTPGEIIHRQLRGSFGFY